MKPPLRVLAALLFTQTVDAAEVWHFLDPWHFHRLDSMEIRLGEPVWRKDKTYVDPVRSSVNDHLNSWATVWHDKTTGKWRMVYSAKWRPATLMVAESHDGLDWKPLPCPDVQPVGGKIAPHHVFTLVDGSVGGAYLDPVAVDGFPFKIFAHRMGRAVIEDAKKDPGHPRHAEASEPEPFKHLADELTLVSKDGIHWEARRDMDWAQPHWHPEPPLFGYWNAKEKRHYMTVRPGWGDRRVGIQSTADFRAWSGPRPLLQPELRDGLVEFYGMPVFRYGEAFVGLLWVFHCDTADSAPPTGYNRFIGSLDTHLAYSYDGEHFQRGPAQPLIPLNSPGEIGGGSIETSCMVETDTGLIFYSEATAAQHGLGPRKDEPSRPPGGIIIHTLRKDGLTYLRSLGGWGAFTSKPLTLLAPRLEINLDAPQGEAVFQLTDMQGRALEGFTFDDCEPIAKVDALRHPLRWRGRTLDAVLHKALRLECRLRNGRLHALRGHFHFLDAEDMQRLQAGKPIDPRWFDY